MVTGSNLATDLQQNVDIYHALFDRANDAILIFEPLAEIILEANAKACEFYGFPRQHLVGMSLKALTKDVPSGERQIRQLLRQGKYDLFETVHFNRRGDELHVLANAAVIEYQGRRAILTINRDVSELKRVQGALKASERRFRSLITSSSEIIAVISAEGRVLFVSPQVEFILSFKPNEVTGTDIFSFIHPDDLSRAQEAMAQCLSTPGHSPPLELRLRYRDGQWIYFEVTGNNLTADPDISGVVVSAREITARKAWDDALRQANDELEERVRRRTADLLHANAALEAEMNERKRTEEQLRQAQKLEAIGRLCGGVAHDFNNILMLIIGYAASLLNQTEVGSPARTNAEQVLKAAERATSLTRQLLAFGRKQVLAPRVLDLNAVLSDFTKMLPRLLGEDIELLFLPESSLGRVKADPAQVELAVMNLALNARDAMPQGGKLTLATRNDVYPAGPTGASVPPGEYVVVSIADTGHGMDRKTQSRIFEPFFSTKGMSKGTGLGLASVHGIVTQSGGHITVHSELGQGTTFQIYLPRVLENLATTQNELPLRPPQGRETILLVEDEAGIREMSRAFLENFGYTVLDARTGKEALKIAEERRGHIDLLITDMIMPGMRGNELAAHLKSSRPEMKVLYISGFADVGVMPDAPILEKPFAFEALGLEIRRILDGRMAAAAHKRH